MSVPVLAVVGCSNAGKTTLLEQLVAILTARGLRIATIKHSHHQPEMDVPGKDSWRHKQAGAVASMLVGPERMQLVCDMPQPFSPRQLAGRYFPACDLVLVEGFAAMPGPKLEVLRAERSLDRHGCGEGLLAVVSDVATLDAGVPLLPLNDVPVVAAFVLDWLEQERGHG